MARIDEKPRRRWFRFSIRTLLVLVTILCIWAALHANKASRQKAAVQAVREYGGWVYYDYQLDQVTGKPDLGLESPRPHWLIDQFGVDMCHAIQAVNLSFNDDTGKRLNNPNISDEIIPELVSFPSLRWLYLHETQVNDDKMQYIGKLRELECLMIWDAQDVSDEGVRHLAGLRRLKKLHIGSGNLADKSLAILSRLPRIEILGLQGNRFTDDGLAHLKNAQNLKALSVGHGYGEITDAGAEHLLGLTSLVSIDLQGYDISDEMQTRLKGLPKLKRLLVSNP